MINLPSKGFILNLPSKGTKLLLLSTFGNSKTLQQTVSHVELSILTKNNPVSINVRNQVCSETF